MKTFNAPAIDIEKLNILDVIATSATECGEDCDGYGGCPNDTCLSD